MAPREKFKNNENSQIADLVEELKIMPEIENIQYDNKWINRLTKIIEIIKLVVLILSALFKYLHPHLLHLVYLLSSFSSAIFGIYHS